MTLRQKILAKADQGDKKAQEFLAKLQKAQSKYEKYIAMLNNKEERIEVDINDLAKDAIESYELLMASFDLNLE